MKKKMFLIIPVLLILLLQMSQAQSIGLPTIISGIWYIALAGLILYYFPAISIAIFILIYELILRLDLAGSVAQGLNSLTKQITKVGGFPGGSISILPANPTKTIDHDSQAEIFKMETPLKIFLNLNRGFLYIAFFLSLLTLFPFQQVFNLPIVVYTAIFTMMNGVILQLEPLFLTILLIVIVPMDKLIDVMSDAVKLLRM